MEKCGFVNRMVVRRVGTRLLKEMERKLFKVRHFQQTTEHTMQTNHSFLLPKGQLQFPFLLLCQLLQLDDISTFIHSTRNSLHIFILLCPHSPPPFLPNRFFAICSVPFTILFSSIHFAFQFTSLSCLDRVREK